MPKPHSVDLRERVLADFDAGMMPAALGHRYHVSRSWVNKLIKQRSDTGCIQPRRGKTGPKPKPSGRFDELRVLVEQHPDATLNELREKLNADVSHTLIWYTLRKPGLTLKKSTARRRAATT